MRVNARVWEQEIVLKRAVRQRSRWPTKVRPRMGHQRSSPENIPFENRNEPSGVSIVLLVSHYLNLSHPGENSVQGGASAKPPGASSGSGRVASRSIQEASRKGFYSGTKNRSVKFMSGDSNS